MKVSLKLTKFAAAKRLLKKERSEIYRLRKSLFAKIAALDALFAQTHKINSEQLASVETELHKVVTHKDRLQSIASARQNLLH